MVKNIPNLFTLLNLVLGVVAIIFILQTGETLVVLDEGTWVPQLPEKIWWGSILIFLAAVVDFLDGFVARLFKATSALGAQLDSLADVVSFGVAPGLILYQLLRIAFTAQDDGLDVPLWSLSPALLFPAAAAWRLARFNVEAPSKSGFNGMPSPAAGIFVASLPLIVFYNYFDIAPLLVNKWVIYAIVVLLSYLMVSNVPFIAMKFGNGTQLKDHVPKIILGIIAVIAAVFMGWLAVPLVIAIYFIISLSTKKQ
jgi:CDP-diacylglycerol--serine O-phosphatidyltransferase